MQTAKRSKHLTQSMKPSENNLLHKHKIQTKCDFDKINNSRQTNPQCTNGKWDLENFSNLIRFYSKQRLKMQTNPAVPPCKDERKSIKMIEKETNLDIGRLRKILEELTDWQDVRFARELGRGRWGIVYLLCNPQVSKQQLVLKITKQKGNFSKYELQHEKKMQRIFNTMGLAPPMYDIKIKTENAFVMGKVDGVLGNILTSELTESQLDTILGWIIAIISKMCSHNITHGDLHWENIGYKINHRTKEAYPVLLDFSNAIQGFCLPQIELLQLIRTSYIIQEDDTLERFRRLRRKYSTHELSDSEIHRTNPIIHNYNYLLTKLRLVYQCNFGSLPDTQKGIEDVFDGVLMQYEVMFHNQLAIEEDLLFEES